jgi:predicted alpha/beta hydrolase family esterase
MPTLKDFSILIHPGLNGSGPDHWHTHWEQAFPDFVRVQQADWDHPVYDRFGSELCNPTKGKKLIRGKAPSIH